MRTSGGLLPIAKTTAWSLLAVLLLGVFVESAFRFFSPAQTPYQKVFPLVETDRNFGWRLRSGLKVEFFGAEVITDATGRRVGSQSKISMGEAGVFLFGPSSAFGWGVSAEEAYGALADPMVNNLSQIGYSSEQGLRLVSEAKVPAGSVVIFSYGINDLDRFRFLFASPSDDAEFFSHPVSILARVMAIAGLRSFAVRMGREWVASFGCRFPTFPLRAAPERVVENLGRFQEILKERGSKLVVMDTAYFQPTDGMDQNPDSDALFQRAQEFASSGDCAGAKAAFLAGMKREPARIAKNVSELNSLLAVWAMKNKVPIVRPSLIANEAKDFSDPVHFSRTGHAKIGLALSSVLLELKGGRVEPK